MSQQTTQNKKHAGMLLITEALWSIHTQFVNVGVVLLTTNQRLHKQTGQAL